MYEELDDARSMKMKSEGQRPRKSKATARGSRVREPPGVNVFSSSGY
jgi:hypothetical protein